MKNAARSPAMALLTLSLAAIAAPAFAEGPPAPVAVRISDFAYQPATVRVKAGTTVRWSNEDQEPHTVTADAGAFRSRGLDAGEGYAFTFEKAGRFPYHCALHPHMTGTVVVE